MGGRREHQVIQPRPPATWSFGTLEHAIMLALKEEAKEGKLGRYHLLHSRSSHLQK